MIRNLACETSSFSFYFPKHVLLILLLGSESSFSSFLSIKLVNEYFQYFKQSVFTMLLFRQYLKWLIIVLQQKIYFNFNEYQSLFQIFDNTKCHHHAITGRNLKRLRIFTYVCMYVWVVNAPPFPLFFSKCLFLLLFMIISYFSSFFFFAMKFSS